MVQAKASDIDLKFNNVIFRSGCINNHYESTGYCAALIFDSTEFQKTANDKITAYN